MIRGGLFTRYFLDDGIRETDAYRAIDPTRLTAFAAEARALWGHLEQMRRPSEAETESVFIFPVLDLLGWRHLPQQEPGRGRRDIADALLFLDDAALAKARATHQTADRFRLGAVVVENEARGTLLDRASGKNETPSTQIIRYLGRAESQSGGVLRWGLLSNGRFWRLYWANARARAEGFLELDLPGLLDTPPPVPAGAPDDHWLRVFLLLFGRDALVARGTANKTYLDEALEQGRRYEQRITAALSRVVFDQVFPALVAAVVHEAPEARTADAAWMAEARDASLRLLYRLLFLLYAEDRDLLPVRDDGYAAYSLRGLREDAARIADENHALSPRARTWWPRLAALFNAVAQGDPSMGLPPYNGGLFDDTHADLLSRLTLPDAVLAPLLDAMSREQEAPRRWINYRDLSVQHLGGIYERLLERDPAMEGGRAVLRPNPYARKTSGSYYTPDDLVQLILRRAIGPLLEERRAAFAERATALAANRRPNPKRIPTLEALDPAEAFLSLRVCDPAMGSGHFLVSLVDYLAAEVLRAVAEAAEADTYPDPPYRSPLVARMEALRERIRVEATARGWPVREDQLDDRHLVRRIILKRVIYGVDLNPMAVELAKLSLWLHSFTVGAPLSFLDHHLRVGDSLFGEFVYPVEDDLRRRFGLVMSQAVVRARKSAAGMALVEGSTDADLSEVHTSAEAFRDVEEGTAELRGFLDLYHAARWLPAEDFVEEAGRGALFGGAYGDPAVIAAGGALTPTRIDPDPPSEKQPRRKVDPVEARARAVTFVEQARELAARRRFLHWEAAFPGVWDEWERAEPTGGFDAVIGNPPWDRIKMQEVEWFAARVPEIALAQRASDRTRMIGALRRAGDPVAAEYDAASGIAGTAASVAAGVSPFADAKERRGASRDYPLLSGGDANLYALFVERASRLVRSDGIVGLLVPSGIAADKGAAAFFRGISTTGRLGALLDFENRRTRMQQDPFFPDVDSRFKFCALIFGSRQRGFADAACAFFQQDAVEAEAASFALSPDDFATVNPNTGTAPVFRTPRDAAITRRIYQRLPVLVDRRGEPPRAVWPVRYVRMFDMTNDSGKFRTEQELVAAGAYKVVGQRWEKGSARWLPLYEGKMVQAFDHRAASIVVNAQNVNRPAQPTPATDRQSGDPSWTPTPQFWISTADLPASNGPVIGFKDVTSPTNHRTMIAALVPSVACGNTLPLLLSDDSGLAPLLLANLNALVLDFVARQKVQGQHLNHYIVEQLPVVPPDAYTRRFGAKTAEAIVRDDVLHLTYVADDMAGFARDQGHAGPPFAWEEEDRLCRRARLDAVFFHLYGLDRDDADYVLGSFPIVRREEEQRWGRYRSRDLTLGFMAALAAGEPDAAVAG
ncbi:MAG: restriction endonuclease [Acetobacteraceae bacterium]